MVPRILTHNIYQGCTTGGPLSLTFIQLSSFIAYGRTGISDEEVGDIASVTAYFPLAIDTNQPELHRSGVHNDLWSVVCCSIVIQAKHLL